MTQPADVRDTVLALLGQRAAGATVCPSEVARRIAATADDWRGEMPAVHAEIDDMVAQGIVTLSWKGVAMPVRAGPYRIAAKGYDGKGTGPGTGR